MKSSSSSTRREPGPVRPWRIGLVLAGLLILGLLPEAARASLSRLEEAVAKKPDDLRLRYLLGRRYAEAGDHRKALEEFRRVAAKKSVPAVMFQLGLAYARVGDLTAAVLNWSQIQEAQPNNLKVLGYLGLATYKQGLMAPNEQLRERMFEESLDWWKRILKLDPANPRARYFSGIEYFKMGRYEDAARQWLIFLRVQKRHPKVLALLAKALLKLGRRTQAKKTLELLQSLDATAKSPPLKQFVEKALAELESTPPGTATRQGNLDDDDTQPGAVTRDPPEVRPLPPGPEPPPPPPLEPRRGPPPPPGEPVDEPVTLQAESLFLDGLDYKEKGNLEKALFAFLQAIDMQPEFTQVYLQIGEVYQGLAALAPTPDQFEERLRLAEGALEKVKTLSPSTLLSHAAIQKLGLVKKAQQQGFAKFHEELGQKAVAEKRESDAFDEFVLLLSTGDLRPTTFLQLAAIMGRLTEGNLQDLRFFLEELDRQRPGQPLALYLLGRTYLRTKDEKLATDGAREALNEAIEGLAKDKPMKEAFLAYVEAGEIDPVDHYLAARLLAREQVPAKALEKVNTFLKGAPRTHVFYRDAAQLKEQLSAGIGSKRSKVPGETFREEQKQLRDTVRESHVFFGEGADAEGAAILTASHLEDLGRFRALKTFVEGQPGNGVARFILAWILRHRADSPKEGANQEALRKESAQLLAQLHKDYLADAWYHHQMGLLVLGWARVSRDLFDEAKVFFKTARQVLLAQGRLRDQPLAAVTLAAARERMEKGDLETAAWLVEQVAVFDAEGMEAKQGRFELALAQGKFFGALAHVPAWAWGALGSFWTRQVLLSDLALLLFLSLLFTALSWSVMLAVRYQGQIHHVVHEFLQGRGILVPLSLLLPAAMVVAFPTGLIVFVPILAWPYMNLRERGVYAGVVLAMFATPLLLPLSLSSNFSLLAAYEAVASGNHATVAKTLEAEIDAANPDFVRLYLLALLHLREGDLEQAEVALAKLAKLDPGHPGVLINQGVRLARKGEYDEARRYFNEAMKRDHMSVPGLLNLSSIHAIKGETKDAEDKGRWAAQMNKDGAFPLQEIAELPSDVTRMPLLDAPLAPEALAPYFRFYGGNNFFALATPLLAFMTWLVLGGGLLGLLIFARERLDIEIKACNHCRQPMCNLCQKVVATKALCPGCANPETRVSLVGDEARVIRNLDALRRAKIVNAFLPGTGLAFADRPLLAALFPPAFAMLVLLRLYDGGPLMHMVYPGFELGSLDMLLSLGLVLAAALWIAAQAAMHAARADVSAT